MPKAEMFINDYERKHAIALEKSNRCEKCPFYYTDNVRNVDLFIDKVQSKCADAKITIIDGKPYLKCYNKYHDYDMDTYKVKIIPMELE